MLHGSSLVDAAYQLDRVNAHPHHDHYHVMLGTLRAPLGILFATSAAIQLGIALYVAAIGPFATQLGPIPILGTNPGKVFSVGLLAGCTAVWLLQTTWSARTRTRVMAMVCWTALAIVLASGVSLIAPVFSRGFPLGHDAPAHLTYVFLFDRAIEQGQLPARWVEGMSDGLGQPLFNYYQVGFYYIVELIHQLGPALFLSLKLAVAAVWTAGAAFVFLWLMPLGVLPAALAASVFAWSPYVLLDGYVRASYPELTALAFAPGILWSIDRWFGTGRLFFLCTLALTTCVVIISHLPTTLIVAPVCTGFTIVQWKSGRHAVRRMRGVLLAALLGLAMAGFYVLPALLELRDIHAAALTSSYFDFRRHFVQPSWWFDQGWTYTSSGVADGHMSLQLGAMQWTLLAGAVAVLAIPSARRLAATRIVALRWWLAVAAGALFMTTTASEAVWNAIPPLAFLQFPWRLLMLPALACAALAALLLSVVRSATVQALVVIAAVTIQWYAMRDARGAVWLNPHVEAGIDDPAWPLSENGRRLAFHEAGYSPAGVVPPSVPADSRWTIVEGKGDVVANSLTDTRLALSVRASEPLRLAVNSPAFPGWEISVDGRTVTPAIHPRSAYMEVPVPSGSHRVEATLKNTPIRTTANLVTAAGMLIWIRLAFAGAKRRLRRHSLQRRFTTETAVFSARSSPSRQYSCEAHAARPPIHLPADCSRGSR